MPEPLYTVEEAVAYLKVVSPYWVKKTARRLGIGTRMARKLVFTEAQLKQLLDAHALEAKQPKAARTPKATQPRAAKPKPTPAPVPGSVTVLRSRPERARSYGRSA
jgi:hypothetical protein